MSRGAMPACARRAQMQGVRFLTAALLVACLCAYFCGAISMVYTTPGYNGASASDGDVVNLVSPTCPTPLKNAGCTVLCNSTIAVPCPTTQMWHYTATAVANTSHCTFTFVKTDAGATAAWELKASAVCR